MTPADRERRTQEEVQRILATGVMTGTAVFRSMVSRIMDVVREDRETAVARERQRLQNFRRNVADYLAPFYIDNPTATADLCDLKLDPSGALLGEVRAAANRKVSEECVQ